MTEPTMSQYATKTLTFAEIEECFPEGGHSNDDGSVTVSAQWLHDFAHAILEARVKQFEAENVELRIRMKSAIGLLYWLKPDLFRPETRAPNMHTPKVRRIHSFDIPGCAVCDPCDGL